VRVVLRFIEGERVRVGNILIQGNVETRDNVLRRDIDLYPGDPLDLEKLERARRDIRRLGFWQIQPPDPSVERPVWNADEEDFVPGGFRFERVDATFSSYQIFRDAYLTLADTPQENVKDLIITVREADTGSLRFAAGIGSNAGLVGDITYTKRNFDPFDFPDGFSDILSAFTGAGQYLNLSFQPGFQRTRWDFTWADPRLFDTRYSLSANFVRTVWLREDWEELRYGYGFTLGRVFGDDLVLSARSTTRWWTPERSMTAPRSWSSTSSPTSASSRWG
jgi:outer membrane protein assembly factor BamA